MKWFDLRPTSLIDSIDAKIRTKALHDRGDRFLRRRLDGFDLLGPHPLERHNGLSSGQTSDADRQRLADCALAMIQKLSVGAF